MSKSKFWLGTHGVISEFKLYKEKEEKQTHIENTRVSQIQRLPDEERLRIITNLLGSNTETSIDIPEYELSIMRATKKSSARYWINLSSPNLVFDNSIPISSSGKAFYIIHQEKGTYKRVHTNGFYRKRVILLVDGLLSYACNKWKEVRK